MITKITIKAMQQIQFNYKGILTFDTKSRTIWQRKKKNP